MWNLPRAFRAGQICLFTDDEVSLDLFLSCFFDEMTAAPGWDVVRDVENHDPTTVI